MVKRSPCSEATKKKISNTLRGHLVSKETREKIGIKNKGMISWNKGTKGVMKANHTSFKKGDIAPETAFKKGLIPWNKGTKYPLERCQKMSDAVMEEKHWRWIADRSKVKRHDSRGNTRDVRFKREVWKRDNFQCKINSATCNGRIVSHHILPWKDYADLRYSMSNCITLCQDHHRKFHHEYGNRNNTPEQLENFLEKECHTVVA